MKLLLQAGIHLIKKVITFVIYGRSVQVFKACTLFYFFPAEFFFSQIFLRGKVLFHRFHRFTQIFSSEFFVPQISQIYTDFSWDVFFSHADFADDADFFSWDFLFIGFHGNYSEISC